MPATTQPTENLRLVSLDIFGVEDREVSARLESRLLNLAGVDGARVDPRSGRATLRVNEGFALRKALALLQLEGFEGSSAEGDEEDEQGDFDRWLTPRPVGRWRFLGAILLLLAYGLLTVAPWAIERWSLPIHLQARPAAWAALGLAGAGFLLSLPLLIRRTWRALRCGSPGDDGLMLAAVLVAAGTTGWAAYEQGLPEPQNAAWVPITLAQASAAALLAFVVAAMLRIAFCERGLWRLRTVPAEREGLQPPLANLLQIDGNTRPVPSHQVLPLEQVKVRVGERIPVDGEIIEGHSLVDARDWGGASEIEAVEEGSIVYAGSRNGAGTLVVASYSAGHRTALARMSERLREEATTAAGLGHEDEAQTAQGRRGRWIGWLTLVAAAALFVGLYARDGAGFAWEIAAAAAATLLAGVSPRAQAWSWGRSMAAGLQSGAATHLWIRDISVIPRLASVDVVVADPSGALSSAPPTVLGPWPVKTGQEVRPEAVLSRLAALSAGRAAPLAKSLLRAATETGLELPHASRPREGGGLGGLVAGREVWVGGWNAALQRGHQSTEVQRLVGLARDAGAVPYLIEEDGRLVAGVGLLDGIQGEGVAALASLSKIHVDTLTMSSTETMTTERLSSQMGARHGEGELTPKDKADRVAALRASGHRPLVLGESSDDGPALAEAWVDAHLGGGADAHMIGSVTLPSGDPRKLAPLVRHARRVTGVGRWITRAFWFWHLALVALVTWGVFGLQPAPPAAYAWLGAGAAMLAGPLLVTALQWVTLRVPGREQGPA